MIIVASDEIIIQKGHIINPMEKSFSDAIPMINLTLKVVKLADIYTIF